MSTHFSRLQARLGGPRLRHVSATAATLSVGLVALAVAGCGSSSKSSSTTSNTKNVNWATETSAAAGGGQAALVKAAKAEGTLNVIALPTNWANYGKEISTFKAKYGIKVVSENPSGSSAQEIEAIKTSRGRSSAPDVVDVGQAYAGASTSLFAPYKVASWSDIPTANKDASGLWYNDYGGYISFGCNLKIVKTCPTSWSQLTEPQYKHDVALNGSPVSANAALSAVWAAALNNGGSYDNIKPGLAFFKKLQADGNFNDADCNAASLIESGQCPIVINWDYLNVAGAWGLPSTAKWQVVDPDGTSFAAYYVQAISKTAPHPAAARLWEEFLYSTQGQNIWLQGNARPVELQAMTAAGTVDKAAAAKLPAVKNVVKSYPTEAQSTKAAAAVTAGWAS
jgi:putative spermidine/putrescine transport system substrate-binding protein